MDPLSNWFRSLVPATRPRNKTAPSHHMVCIPLRFELGSVESPPASASPSIATLNSDGKEGGPAFAGQVFSMCDLSGSGLMAVSNHFNIPFLSQRSPEWLKRFFSSVVKSERNGPVFRFFLDLGDAVTYVKRMDIPSLVGACPLDYAYERFKEKPNSFQFVPNEQQVKAANRLLKTISRGDRRKKIDGVPVFSAENLDIAVLTSDGIKWSLNPLWAISELEYTPYFFDKHMLDDILEESADRHFHFLIQNRHKQRQDVVMDDTLAAEEMGDNGIESPEDEELLDVIGPEIRLISKVAEIYLLNAVDKVILGNRWFRKATGIQPKYPYVVDSFERRSAASSRQNAGLARSLPNSERDTSALGLELRDDDEQRIDLRLPFGNWFPNPWLEQHKAESDTRSQDSSKKYLNPKLDPNPLLPKVTMVGISASKAVDQCSEGNFKKILDDLTRELEQEEHENSPDAAGSGESMVEERDPLFVANMVARYPAFSKASLLSLREGKK